ncbi:MAG: DUF2842 domain-containing protein [Rhodobacteraceae bacterium]|nr:DUF2842 domain-containing protein [Paracoccaceae bacterium]
MAMSYKKRRLWSVIILVVGLPLYIMVSMLLFALWVSYFGRPPIVVELIIYAVLGVLWALPLKSVFMGVGKADPDAEQSKTD